MFLEGAPACGEFCRPARRKLNAKSARKIFEKIFEKIFARRKLNAKSVRKIFESNMSGGWESVSNARDWKESGNSEEEKIY